MPRNEMNTELHFLRFSFSKFTIMVTVVVGWLVGGGGSRVDDGPVLMSQICFACLPFVNAFVTVAFV